MPNRSESDPKVRILDAAESVFADHGFEGASMREIVLKAGVNLATVYYHFRSKDGLMEAVLRRRFAPLHAEHLESLRRLEQEAQGEPLPVAKLLEAMLQPALRVAASTARESQAAMRLIGRIVNEPDAKTQELLHRLHQTVREAYLSALQRSAPRLTDADLQWRFEFFWGALAAVLCNPAKLDLMTSGVCRGADTDALQAQILACFTAAFNAPSAAKRTAASRPARPRKP